MKINELIQLLSKKDTQNNSARLAFLNYLKYFCDSEDNFSVDTVDSFYDRALCFQGWRDQKQNLGESLLADLRFFNGAQLEGVLHSHQIQWLEIEHSRDFNELIANENQILQKRSEDIRTVKLDKGRLLRIRRRLDKSVRVEVKARLAFIEGSQIHLARPESNLSYTADLELQENHSQVLQISPLKVARFQIQDEVIQGFSLHAGNFSRLDRLTGHLEDNPELFYSLKRIEKQFINPHSDPHYMALSSQLEKAIQLCRTQHPDHLQVSGQVLQKAETFAREVFSDDKGLKDLISTLKYSACREDSLRTNQQSRSQVEICQNPTVRPQTEKFV